MFWTPIASTTMRGARRSPPVAAQSDRQAPKTRTASPQRALEPTSTGQAPVSAFPLLGYRSQGVVVGAIVGIGVDGGLGFCVGRAVCVFQKGESVAVRVGVVDTGTSTSTVSTSTESLDRSTGVLGNDFARVSHPATPIVATPAPRQNVATNSQRIEREDDRSMRRPISRGNGCTITSTACVYYQNFENMHRIYLCVG
jgi:hypothetical protein